MRSRRRPGVAIKISTHARSFSTCFPCPTPPNITVAVSQVYRPYARKLSSVWIASSRVGVMMRVRIFLCFEKVFSVLLDFPSERSCKIGIAKEAVFPVPVCAHPRKSRPFRIEGIDFSWIGVAFLYPSSWIARRIGSIIGNSEKSIFVCIKYMNSSPPNHFLSPVHEVLKSIILSKSPPKFVKLGGKFHSDITPVPWFYFVFIDVFSVLVTLSPTIKMCIPLEPLHIGDVFRIFIVVFFCTCIEKIDRESELVFAVPRRCTEAIGTFSEIPHALLVSSTSIGRYHDHRFSKSEIKITSHGPE